MEFIGNEISTDKVSNAGKSRLFGASSALQERQRVRDGAIAETRSILKRISDKKAELLARVSQRTSATSNNRGGISASILNTSNPTDTSTLPLSTHASIEPPNGNVAPAPLLGSTNTTSIPSTEVGPQIDYTDITDTLTISYDYKTITLKTNDVITVSHHGINDDWIILGFESVHDREYNEIDTINVRNLIDSMRDGKIALDITTAELARKKKEGYFANWKMITKNIDRIKPGTAGTFRVGDSITGKDSNMNDVFLKIVRIRGLTEYIPDTKEMVYNVVVRRDNGQKIYGHLIYSDNNGRLRYRYLVDFDHPPQQFTNIKKYVPPEQIVGHTVSNSNINPSATNARIGVIKISKEDGTMIPYIREGDTIGLRRWVSGRGDNNDGRRFAKVINIYDSEVYLDETRTNGKKYRVKVAYNKIDENEKDYIGEATLIVFDKVTVVPGGIQAYFKNPPWFIRSFETHYTVMEVTRGAGNLPQGGSRKKRSTRRRYPKSQKSQRKSQRKNQRKSQKSRK
jgi:hypothetical protein